MEVEELNVWGRLQCFHRPYLVVVEIQHLKKPPLEVLVHELYRDVAAHGEVGDLGDPLVLAMQVGETEQPGRILLAWILHTTNY